MSRKPNRRNFLQEVALAASATQVQAEQSAPSPQTAAPLDIAYPRVFSGRQTKMIAFPLGGVAAGAISLGGRGQLRDWEIFNKPDKGAAPNYAFPSIWAQAGNGKPVARVDSGVQFAAGHLLFLRNHVLVAQRFDPKRWEAVGPEFPIAGNIAAQNAMGAVVTVGEFSAAATAIAYRSTTDPGTVTIARNWTALAP